MRIISENISRICIHEEFMNRIEQFIDKFKFKYKTELEYIFTSSNCYYFVAILQEHFNGEIYYLPISNHFICKIDKEYYDITGKAKFDEHPYKWKEFEEYDKSLYKRIVRDCIDFSTRK